MLFCFCAYLPFRACVRLWCSLVGEEDPQDLCHPEGYAVLLIYVCVFKVLAFADVVHGVQMPPMGARPPMAPPPGWGRGPPMMGRPPPGFPPHGARPPVGGPPRGPPPTGLPQGVGSISCAVVFQAAMSALVEPNSCSSRQRGNLRSVCVFVVLADASNRYASTWYASPRNASPRNASSRNAAPWNAANRHAASWNATTWNATGWNAPARWYATANRCSSSIRFASANWSTTCEIVTKKQ